MLVLSLTPSTHWKKMFYCRHLSRNVLQFSGCISGMCLHSLSRGHILQTELDNVLSCVLFHTYWKPDCNCSCLLGFFCSHFGPPPPPHKKEKKTLYWPNPPTLNHGLTLELKKKHRPLATKYERVEEWLHKCCSSTTITENHDLSCNHNHDHHDSLFCYFVDSLSRYNIYIFYRRWNKIRAMQKKKK